MGQQTLCCLGKLLDTQQLKRRIGFSVNFGTATEMALWENVDGRLRRMSVEMDYP